MRVRNPRKYIEFGIFGYLILGFIDDSQVVPVLLKALKYRDWRVRYAAVRALEIIGDVTAVPGLAETAIGDRDMRVRHFAMMALKEIGDSQSIFALVKALRDCKGNTRRSAAKALEDIAFMEVFGRKVLAKIAGSPAVLDLIQALNDRVWEVRCAAARTLGRIGDPQSIPNLTQVLLEDPTRYVRAAAAGALGDIGNSQAVPALLKALKDHRSEVVNSAIFALGQIGSSRAVPELLKIFSAEDKEVKLRASAVNALGKIGDPDAIPTLLRALASDDYNMSVTVASALEQISTKLQSIASCRQVIKALYRHYKRQIKFENLENIANHLAVLEADAETVTDPLLP